MNQNIFFFFFFSTINTYRSGKTRCRFLQHHPRRCLTLSHHHFTLHQRSLYNIDSLFLCEWLWTTTGILVRWCLDHFQNIQQLCVAAIGHIFNHSVQDLGELLWVGVLHFPCVVRVIRAGGGWSVSWSAGAYL